MVGRDTSLAVRPLSFIASQLMAAAIRLLSLRLDGGSKWVRFGPRKGCVSLFGSSRGKGVVEILLSGGVNFAVGLIGMGPSLWKGP